MRPFSSRNRVTFTGLLVLLPGAIVLGIATGALAYVVSQLIYFIVIFSLAMVIIGAIGYRNLIRFSKVRLPALTGILGAVVGLLIVGTYYSVPYLIFHNQLSTEIQKYYQVDAQAANRGIDYVLEEETGSSGLLGFMKLRTQDKTDKYSFYFMANAFPVQEFNFKLPSNDSWFYWAFETILIVAALSALGFGGIGDFNLSANSWYDSIPGVIGVAPAERQEEFFALAQANDQRGIGALIVDRDQWPHPVLELYEQHSKNKQGDVLLILKRSYRDKKGRIKRAVAARWEVSQQDYALLLENILPEEQNNAGSDTATQETP